MKKLLMILAIVAAAITIDAIAPADNVDGQVQINTAGGGSFQVNNGGGSSGPSFTINGGAFTYGSTINFEAGTNVTLTNPTSGTLHIVASATAATAWSAVTSGANNNTLTMGSSGTLAPGSGHITANIFSGLLALANGGLNAALTATPGGLLYSDVSSAGISAPGTAGQAALSGGTGAPTFGDLWLPVKVIPANCNGTSPGAGMSLPSSGAPTPVCRTGTNVQAGALQFTGSQSAQWQDEAPKDWDTAQGPYVVAFYTQAAATSGLNIQYQVQAACSATTDDGTFNTAQVLNPTTTSATANTPYTHSIQLNSASITGCLQWQMINFKISTTSGTNTPSNLQMVTVTWPHKTPGIAQGN